MITSKPITTEDGRIFDRLSISIAITSRVDSGVYTAGAACRIVPMRILDNGDSEELPDEAKSVLLGDTASLQADTPERNAMAAIYDAIQAFIIQKEF